MEGTPPCPDNPASWWADIAVLSGNSGAPTTAVDIEEPPWGSWAEPKHKTVAAFGKVGPTGKDLPKEVRPRLAVDIRPYPGSLACSWVGTAALSGNSEAPTRPAGTEAPPWGSWAEPKHKTVAAFGKVGLSGKDSRRQPQHLLRLLRHQVQRLRSRQPLTVLRKSESMDNRLASDRHQPPTVLDRFEPKGTAAPSSGSQRTYNRPWDTWDLVPLVVDTTWLVLGKRLPVDNLFERLVFDGKAGSLSPASVRADRQRRLPAAGKEG